MQVREEEPIRQ